MRLRKTCFRAIVYALAVCLLASCLCVPALAEEGAPGALIAPVTPKPWLIQAETAVPQADEDTSQAPSSLNALEEDDPALTMQATASPSSVEIVEDMPATAMRDRLRILLIGTDAYKPTQRGRSDTMVLAQVDVQTGEIKLVSFLRDLYVRIPNHGSTRLNAAYVYGGAELLKQTLADNFGVKVDCTLAVNFSLMVTLMDRIGGVWVEVSPAERKQLNSILKFYNTWNGFDRGDQLLEDSGLQLLTGKQALCYSRIRKIDSDFQRTGRQRKVLMGIFNRVREMDALTLAEILRESYGEVSTDLTLSDVAKLLPLVYQLENATFDSLTVPVTNGYRSETVHGSDVLTPNLKKNREAIADFLY